MRTLTWDNDAWEDYIYWQSQNKRTLKRINALIKEVLRNPFQGTGKPEPLRGADNPYWSRRINNKDRLVYIVTQESIIIIACRGHYE